MLTALTGIHTMQKENIMEITSSRRVFIRWSIARNTPEPSLNPYQRNDYRNIRAERVAFAAANLRRFPRPTEDRPSLSAYPMDLWLG